jgi:hypothetical protein
MREVKRYRSGLSIHGVEWKKQGKHCSVALFLLTASKAQSTMVSVNNLTAYPETEPRSADPLRRIKRFEYSTLNQSGHATTRVCDGD